MMCFPLSYCEGKDEEPKTPSRSIPIMSFNSKYPDSDMRQSESESDSQSVSTVSTKSLGKAKYPSFSQRSSHLKEFTFSELKSVTKSFHVSAKIGEGGFGSVYTGVIKSHQDSSKNLNVAVKQLGKRGFQGHKEWVTEVNVLGVVDHPNLVKLIGYCEADDEKGIQRLLVYEYMPNRSVEYHLSTRSEAPVSWSMRLKIAQDAARGLAYLHEEMDFQIIFRDFKSSNILLDDQWNAKLSDFGMARLGPKEGRTHVSTAVVGTMGYAAPEYIQTGHLTSKSDIWSYGVFLYELITGRRPMDRTRPKSEQDLLEWVRPYLDAKNFRVIVDYRLEGKYSLKSAIKLSMIANKCLAMNPRTRPKMSEVLEMVNQLIAVPSELCPRSPVKVLVPVVESNDPCEGKKISEDMKNKGKRRAVDMKLGDFSWFSRLWSSKLVISC